MHSYSRTFFLASALAGLALTNAQASCTIASPACASPTSTTYVAEPCFPNTGVCSPTNYYAAQDQGQFSGANGAFDTQLMAKCKATCDAQSQCLSFTGVINKAADSNLATGTCFFFSVKQIYPRQCADAPSEVIAYYKQGVCPVTTTSSSTTTKKTTTSSSTTKSTTTSSSTTKSTTTSSSTTKSTTTSSSTTSSSSTTKSTTTSSSTTSSSTTSSSATSSSTTSSSTTSSSTTSSSTTTSSTTTTSSSTTSSAATPTVSMCPNGFDYSGAGCSQSLPNNPECHCEESTENYGFCTDITQCGQACNVSGDCPSGYLCIVNTVCNNNGQTCAYYADCDNNPNSAKLRRSVRELAVSPAHVFTRPDHL